MFARLAVVDSSSVEPRAPRLCFPPCLFISWSWRLFGAYLYAKDYRLVEDGRIGDGCFAPVKNRATRQRVRAYSLRNAIINLSYRSYYILNKISCF